MSTFTVRISGAVLGLTYPDIGARKGSRPVDILRAISDCETIVTVHHVVVREGEVSSASGEAWRKIISTSSIMAWRIHTVTCDSDS